MAKKVNIQGHRGCRGLYPENTITSFIEAVKLGVDTLEMDVVISKDMKVVVSHEPWMNEVFCSTPDGNAIEKGSAEKYNLYKMQYEEIRAYDCGKRGNPEFPMQKKIAGYKPLLSEVISSVEAYIKTNNLPPVIYNIEIKSEPSGDNVFHPEPGIFIRLVYNEIKKFNILDRTLLQSFDTRILQKIHQTDPAIRTGLLVENGNSLEKNLDHLGFSPFTYNPYFQLINKELVLELHKRNIQIAAWTVNNASDMNRLIDMGIDSIITDYPDKAIELIK